MRYSAPEREPRETLDMICEQIESYAFSAQHLQNPAAGNSYHLRLDRMTLIEQGPLPGNANNFDLENRHPRD